MKFPVFDLHCDTALAILGDDLMGEKNLRANDLHIDLERAKTLDGYAQCFACFTFPDIELPSGKTVVHLFEREVDVIHRDVQANSDLIRIAYSAQEVRENDEAGLMSAILTIEGPAGFDFDPALLEDLYNLGFRISTLTWNEKNPLAGSHKTGGGLTEKGREYVREAQRVGMLIDVSHLSDEAFWDLMEITTAPIIASHSNSRSVCGVSRNLTDEMFLAICSTGGVAGINLYSAFLGDVPTVDTVCDHIFHFMKLDPTGRHIALGGDLDGCESIAAGMSGIQDYPRIAQRLLSRGLDEETVHRIFWDNALEVLEKCSM